MLSYAVQAQAVAVSEAQALAINSASLQVDPRCFFLLKVKGRPESDCPFTAGGSQAGDRQTAEPVCGAD
jgi:hypothetical protein